MIRDDLRLKGTVPVTRSQYRYFAVLTLQALGGIAVTAVAGATAFKSVLLISKMLIQFGVACGLDGELDQLLSEGSEIFFRLNVFGQLGWP